MSDDVDTHTDLTDSDIARYLANSDGDTLINALVAALQDTFRILMKDAETATAH